MMKFFPVRAFAFIGVTTAVLMIFFTACASEHHPSRTESTTRNGQIPTRDGRNSVSAVGGTTNGANGPEYRVPTGSQIPQQYNRRGYTTDRQDPAFIYDDNDIRLQRTNNVGDSLRDVPGVNVGGPR